MKRTTTARVIHSESCYRITHSVNFSTNWSSVTAMLLQKKSFNFHKISISVFQRCKKKRKKRVLKSIQRYWGSLSSIPSDKPNLFPILMLCLLSRIPENLNFLENSLKKVLRKLTLLYFLQGISITSTLSSSIWSCLLSIIDFISKDSRI